MSTETATNLWTYTATAKRLGLPTTSLRNMVARRTVPFIRIGPRTVRFEPSVSKRGYAHEARSQMAAQQRLLAEAEATMPTHLPSYPAVAVEPANRPREQS